MVKIGGLKLQLSLKIIRSKKYKKKNSWQEETLKFIQRQSVAGKGKDPLSDE